MNSLRSIISFASLQPGHAVLFSLLLPSAAIDGPELLLKPAPSAMALVPELLWNRGNPALESSWESSAQAFPGASQMWVGPGYIPLQFRMSFSDGIHLSSAGNHFVAGLVNAFITSKGW